MAFVICDWVSGHWAIATALPSRKFSVLAIIGGLPHWIVDSLFKHLLSTDPPPKVCNTLFYFVVIIIIIIITIIIIFYAGLQTDLALRLSLEALLGFWVLLMLKEEHWHCSLAYGLSNLTVGLLLENMLLDSEGNI